MDAIWTFVENKLKASVPTYCKNVLDACGYSNGISISLIGPDDLKYVEDEVKNGNVGRALAGTSRDDYLKDCPRKEESFEFVLGHKKFLLAVADFLKNYIAENGADSLTSSEKHSKSRKNPSKISASKKKDVVPSRRKVTKLDPRVIELVNYGMSTQLSFQKKCSTIPTEILAEHRKVLLEKAIGSAFRITPKLFKESIGTIRESISNDFLLLELDPDCEDTIATVKCVYCPKTATVYLRPTPTSPKLWKTSNYDRHMRIIHRFEDSPPDDIDLESDTESKKSARPSDKLSDFDKDFDEMQSVKLAVRGKVRGLKDTVTDLNEAEEKNGLKNNEALNGSTDDIENEASQGNRMEKLSYLAGKLAGKYTRNETVTLPLPALNQVVNATGNRKEKLNDGGEKQSGKYIQNETATFPLAELNITVTAPGDRNRKVKLNDVGEETAGKYAQKEIPTLQLEEFYILKNGAKTRIGNTTIVTTHTCAFDTIMNTFASIYSENVNVREQLNGSQSNISQLLKSFFNRSSEVNDPYANRNSILKQLYEGWCNTSNIQTNNDSTFINCTTGIGSLFAKMCKFEENFASAIYERTCMKCGTVYKKVTPFLKTTNKVRNLGKVAEYLDLKHRERDCLACKSKCKGKMHFNNVVVLETEPQTKHRNEIITLQSITPELKIESTTYALCAVMHFDAKNEHFVAYICDRSKNWKCYDDLKKNVQKVDARTKVNPFIVCYARPTRKFDFENSIEAMSVEQSVEQSIEQSIRSLVSSLKEQPNNPHQIKHEPQDVPELATEPALPVIQNEENSKGKRLSEKRKKHHSSKNKKKRIE